MKMLFILLLISALVGCASGYKKFYTPLRNPTPEAVASTRVNSPSTGPLVERSKGFPDNDYFASRGYAVIGYSSFNSGSAEPESSAIEQARTVGADLVVIINPKYTNTVNSQIPITTPTSETSYSSGSATAYGSGGTATAYGSSTTTTYGTKTTYIPMAVRRYDYGAVYYVKRKYSLGVNWRALTTEERKVLQSNAGVYITSVVQGTPAFKADILPGDIFVAMNGEPIYGSEAAAQLVNKNKGLKTEISLSRNGVIIKKVVTLGK